MRGPRRWMRRRFRILPLPARNLLDLYTYEQNYTLNMLVTSRLLPMLHGKLIKWKSVLNFLSVYCQQHRPIKINHHISSNQWVLPTKTKHSYSVQHSTCVSLFSSVLLDVTHSCSVSYGSNDEGIGIQFPTQARYCFFFTRVQINSWG